MNDKIFPERVVEPHNDDVWANIGCRPGFVKTGEMNNPILM